MEIRKIAAKILMAGVLLFPSILSACHNGEETEDVNVEAGISSGEAGWPENKPSADGEEPPLDSAGEENITDGPQEDIWLSVKESELPEALTENPFYFRMCTVGTMEYAIVDVLGYMISEKGEIREGIWEQHPFLNPSGKLFLKRKQGGDTWQARLLDFDSVIPYWEENGPGIAFEDEERGMVMFGWWYTVLAVTEDGGETWE